MENKNNNIPDSLPDYYRKPTDLSPMLEVCHNIAEKMHKEQVRDKTGELRLPYITHLNITHHILEMAGIEDPAVLGAALLHDAMEDTKDEHTGERSFKTKESFEAYISRQLRANDIKNANTFASHLATLVDELTNPIEYENTGDKRNEQVLKMRDISDEARIIKTAEQTASLIDDVIYPSSRPDIKLRHYALKVRDIVAAANEGTPPNPKLYGMARAVFREHHTMLSTPLETRGAPNADFTVEDMFEKGESYQSPPATKEPAHKIGYLDSGREGYRIGEIHFNDVGHVIGLKMRDDIVATPNALNMLRSAIEEHHHDSSESREDNNRLQMVSTKSHEICGEMKDARYVQLDIIPPMQQVEFKTLVDLHAPLDRSMEMLWDEQRPKEQDATTQVHPSTSNIQNDTPCQDR